MLSGSTNEQKVWNYLMGKIGNAFGVAGLMGNLYAESGLIPNRVEILCLKRLKENGLAYDDATYTAAVDSGAITRAKFLNPLTGKQYGYGLAQWTSPGRKGNLYDFVKEKGASIGDLETQLEFLMQELGTSYKTVLSTIKTATSVRSASDVVLKKFECPANTGETVCKARASYGQKYYDKYATKTTSTTKGGTSVTDYSKYLNSSGTHYISNCGSDENGGYSGGTAGDQTGKEWYLRSWFNRPWNCVLRHPKETVRTKLAELACAAAINDLIGYDQNQRDSYWNHLKASDYDPSKITVACEADCSSGVCANIRAVGYLLGIAALKNHTGTYTGNMRAALKAAGFQVLTDSKYLTSADYLLPGDILLNDAHHTATNITKGSKASADSTDSSSGNSSGNSSKGYLSKGDTGTEVKTMQTMLIACGYSCGSSGADGDFGANTDTALRKFQKAAGLTVDGCYGSASKAALEAAYKKATGSASSGKTSGTAASSSGTLNKTPKWVGKVTTNNVNVRDWPGSGKSIKSWPKLGKDNLIDVCDTLQDSSGNNWYYVRISGKYYGFVQAKYVKKK